MSDTFIKASKKISDFAGSPWAFLLAFSFIIGWAIFGYSYGWSDRHSLFVNTATTIVTFLMVFLIQDSQNKEAKALQLKLDALIRAIENADNKWIGIEKATLKELKNAEKEVENGRDLTT